MKRLALILPLLALAACNREANEPSPAQPRQAEAPKGGPPPIPPYQMRAEQPGGDRLAAGRDGKAVFEHQCGACHLAGGMGTNLLTKQRMLAGETPDKGMLTNRTDLTPDYVKQVVRAGRNAMPPQTKVDLTDAELDSVAAYLGKAK
jgi:mono/diheme cytochrome c family protein